MKLHKKDYTTLKTKKYLKKNKLLFLFSGVNQNFNNWILTEQGLKVMHFGYYKVYNQTATRTIKNSIYSRIKSAINGTTFFIKHYSSSEILSRQVLLNKFEPMFFTLLAIKLNNKVYGPNQLKNINSINYKECNLLLYQFGVTHLKSCFTFQNLISK